MKLHQYNAFVLIAVCLFIHSFIYFLPACKLAIVLYKKNHDSVVNFNLIFAECYPFSKPSQVRNFHNSERARTRLHRTGSLPSTQHPYARNNQNQNTRHQTNNADCSIQGRRSPRPTLATPYPLQPLAARLVGPLGLDHETLQKVQQRLLLRLDGQHLSAPGNQVRAVDAGADVVAGKGNGTEQPSRGHDLGLRSYN
jgi:hypothetical protein